MSKVVKRSSTCSNRKNEGVRIGSNDSIRISSKWGDIETDSADFSMISFECPPEWDDI